MVRAITGGPDQCSTTRSLTLLTWRARAHGSAADGTRDMQAMNQLGGAGMMMPGAGAGMPGQPAQDFVKLFHTERDNLEIIEYRWVADQVEQRLLAKFGNDL